MLFQEISTEYETAQSTIQSLLQQNKDHQLTDEDLKKKVSQLTEKENILRELQKQQMVDRYSNLK